MLRLAVGKQARWAIWFLVRPVKCLQSRMRAEADKGWKRFLPLTPLTTEVFCIQKTYWKDGSRDAFKLPVNPGGTDLSEGDTI